MIKVGSKVRIKDQKSRWENPEMVQHRGSMGVVTKVIEKSLYVDIDDTPYNFAYAPEDLEELEDSKPFKEGDEVWVRSRKVLEKLSDRGGFTFYSTEAPSSVRGVVSQHDSSDNSYELDGRWWYPAKALDIIDGPHHTKWKLKKAAKKAAKLQLYQTNTDGDSENDTVTITEPPKAEKGWPNTWGQARQMAWDESITWGMYCDGYKYLIVTNGPEAGIAVHHRNILTQKKLMGRYWSGENQGCGTRYYFLKFQTPRELHLWMAETA